MPPLPAGVPCGVYDLKVTTVVSELYAVNASSGTKITVTSELPTVTNVNPSQVYNTDGGTVAITGTRFYGGTDAGAGLHTPNVYKIELNTGSTTYTVDSTPYAYPYTPLSINSVTASDALITGVSIPKGLLMGTYDVRVYNGMGANAASSVKLRITTRPPIVNTIVPNTGKDTAPRTISVTGTGFYGGLNSSDVSAVKLVSSSESVTIAPGVPGLSGYTVVSDSQLNNIIVPGSVTAKIESGAYDVIVVNTGGEGTSTTKYTCLIDSLDTASRTIASLDTQVTVSPGAFSTDTAVILNKSPAPAVQAVVDQGNNAKYVNLKMRANLGTWVWDLKNSVADISIAPSTATINPNGEVTLTISFAALSIPDSNIKKSLRLVTLNSKNRWELVDGTQTVDELADTLTVSLAHFSVYRLTQLISAASNLDGVKVFPNPVDMGASARNTVKFANLTLNPVISIYTISGEFVVTLTPDASNLNNDGASGKAEWDGKNSQGELVQRGMYIYLIRDDAGRKKSGKIVIK